MEVELPSTFTNAGTLNLSATGQNHNILVEGSTLNNTGTTNINPGPTADGQREFDLALDNSGTFNVNASTTIDENLTNAGNITIAAGKTLNIYEYRTFTQSSGTLIINGSLNLNGDTFYDDGAAIAGRRATPRLRQQ